MGVKPNAYTFTRMRTHRFAVGLTVLNLFILLCSLFRANSAPPPEIPSVLRAHGLEIVDDQGRVRAMVKVFPTTNGYPETVLLRLIDSKGRPNVKIAATEDGSGASFGGESDPTDIQLLARGTNTFIKLVNRDGQQQMINPH